MGQEYAGWIHLQPGDDPKARGGVDGDQHRQHRREDDQLPRNAD